MGDIDQRYTRDELYDILCGAATMTVGADPPSVAAGDRLSNVEGESHSIIEIDSQLTVHEIFME